MIINPFAPKMTETQRSEAMRRYEHGVDEASIQGRTGPIGKNTRTEGVPFQRLAKRPTAEDILAMLRSVHASTGQPVSSTSLRESRTVSIGTVIKRFGSVESARKMAGVPFERRIEQHDGRVGRSGSPARAGVKSPERETTRWTAVRPLKGIEG